MFIATKQQIKQMYNEDGYQIKIDTQGRISFKSYKDNRRYAGWLNGGHISEYRHNPETNETFQE